jgi:peroxiredoxin
MKKLFALIAAVAFVGVFAISASAEEAKIVYGSNVGDLAKPIVMKSVDGAKSVDTAKLAKKSVFVMVNTVCGMCQREMGDIARSKDMFKEVDLYIVVVDQDSERATSKYKEFLDVATLLHDPDFKLGDNVGIFSTPSTLVLGTDGKIIYKESGYKPDVLKKMKEIL